MLKVVQVARCAIARPPPGRASGTLGASRTFPWKVCAARRDETGRRALAFPRNACEREMRTVYRRASGVRGRRPAGDHEHAARGPNLAPLSWTGRADGGRGHSCKLCRGHVPPPAVARLRRTSPVVLQAGRRRRRHAPLRPLCDDGNNSSQPAVGGIVVVVAVVVVVGCRPSRRPRRDRGGGPTKSGPPHAAAPQIAR
jgi:hypothetical protein